MIRFVCGTCGRPLRAPDSLSGKRGRCARCGAINRVPEPLSVEVKRAEAPSPFRSTADLAVRLAIDGNVDVPDGRFADAAPVATTVADAEGNPRDFFDQVASRLTDAQPVHADVQPEYPAAPVRPQFGERPPADRAPATSTERYEYVRAIEKPAPDFARAVAAALAVGAVIGFCVGLITSKWVL
jgi:hypothetical protein